MRVAGLLGAVLYTRPMPLNDLIALPSHIHLPSVGGAQRWWKRLTPHRQDRVAMLAPLAAVLLFFAAIVAALGYLRVEEVEREQQAVRRDVEYAQQRVRLRLLERQEQLMRMARDLSNHELDTTGFRTRAAAMLDQYPEIYGVAWIDEKRKVKVSLGSTVLPGKLLYSDSENTQRFGQDSTDGFAIASETRQPLFIQRPRSEGYVPLLQLFLPLTERSRPGGVVLAEFSVDGLYRYAIPPEVTAQYAVSLVDSKGGVLAGTTIPPRSRLNPWTQPTNEYSMPVSPVGIGLMIRAQAYRASLGMIGSGQFWLVAALSVMTAWMLIANWRHTRRRLQAQQALVSETNFRRAMENSMLTGMRAMDLQGRITYVNAAFCQMTGWRESDLVGRTAPFPYWPDAERDHAASRLEAELTGHTAPGGIQVRIKRRDNTLFDARLYVSPLIDALGTQTGWVTSMTDITEPNRVRDQLSASHQRFTTVLEALDAAISVAPLGGDELLFANKLYRQWFGMQSNGHLALISALVRSFEVFAVGDEPFAFLRQTQPQRWGSEVFMLGLWIALPLVGMLLFVNLVLGVISRVAPQISVFSVGFPITVTVGLIGMLLTLPLLEAPFVTALQRMVEQFE